MGQDNKNQPSNAKNQVQPRPTSGQKAMGAAQQNTPKAGNLKNTPPSAGSKPQPQASTQSKLQGKPQSAAQVRPQLKAQGRPQSRPQGRTQVKPQAQPRGAAAKPAQRSNSQAAAGANLAAQAAAVAGSQQAPSGGGQQIKALVQLMKKSEAQGIKEEAVPVLLVSPYSETVKKLRENFEKSDSIKPHDSDLDNVFALAAKEVPCLIIANILESKDILKYLNALKVAKPLFTGNKIKFIVISKINNGSIIKAFESLGCQEYIIESIADKSLNFKMNLHTKALFGQRKRLVQSAAAKDKVFKSSKSKPGEQEEEQSEEDKKKTKTEAANEMEEDVWVFKKNKPKRQGGKWTMRMKGPDPSKGEWVEKKNEDGSSQWRFLEKESEKKENETEDYTEEGKKGKNGGWEWSGEKPTFQNGEWSFQGENPDLSFVDENGEKKASKVKMDGDNIVMAEDSKKALEKVAEQEALEEQERNKKKGSLFQNDSIAAEKKKRSDENSVESDSTETHTDDAAIETELGASDVNTESSLSEPASPIALESTSSAFSDTPSDNLTNNPVDNSNDASGVSSETDSQSASESDQPTSSARESQDPTQSFEDSADSTSSVNRNPFGKKKAKEGDSPEPIEAKENTQHDKAEFKDSSDLDDVVESGESTGFEDYLVDEEEVAQEADAATGKTVDKNPFKKKKKSTDQNESEEQSASGESSGEDKNSKVENQSELQNYEVAEKGEEQNSDSSHSVNRNPFGKKKNKKDSDAREEENESQSDAEDLASLAMDFEDDEIDGKNNAKTEHIKNKKWRGHDLSPEELKNKKRNDEENESEAAEKEASVDDLFGEGFSSEEEVEGGWSSHASEDEKKHRWGARDSEDETETDSSDKLVEIDAVQGSLKAKKAADGFIEIEQAKLGSENSIWEQAISGENKTYILVPAGVRLGDYSSLEEITPWWTFSGERPVFVDKKKVWRFKEKAPEKVLTFDKLQTEIQSFLQSIWVKKEEAQESQEPVLVSSPLQMLVYASDLYFRNDDQIYKKICGILKKNMSASVQAMITLLKISESASSSVAGEPMVRVLYSTHDEYPIGESFSIKEQKSFEWLQKSAQAKGCVVNPSDGSMYCPVQIVNAGKSVSAGILAIEKISGDKKVDLNEKLVESAACALRGAFTKAA